MNKNYDKIQDSISTLIDKLDANLELNNYGISNTNDSISSRPYQNNTIEQLADVIEKLNRVAGSIYYREQYVKDIVGTTNGDSSNV